MELLVAADSLFFKTEDEKIWCKTIYSYNFWKRYLDVFEKVVIVSRTKRVMPNEVEGFLRVDGPGIRVAELPYLRGMTQYLLNYFSIKKATIAAVKNVDCAIIRLPSVSAFMVLNKYIHLKKPFALEIVADPFDAYKNNKIAQFIYTKKLKRAAVQANGVSYVTEFYLQSKYPSSKRLTEGQHTEYFESFYSTIDLHESFLYKPRNYSNKEKYTIIHTANSINNYNKGHVTVLQILKKLRQAKIDVSVIFIGDGTIRSKLERLAEKLKIRDYVEFTGLLSSNEDIRNYLIKADLFVFPTKAEGLPRALIEAMSVGLPCLSTPVNGIPELLTNEYLFEPNDVIGFTNKLIDLMKNPIELENMSKDNFYKAKNYIIEKLSGRRREYYSNLKNIAEKYVKNKED